jgi:choline dehydrogenase
MIGGSSAINGMVWARGQPQDFDAWARLGNRGWSYRDVLPIFKRMESYVGGDDEYRGRSGPMRIVGASRVAVALYLGRCTRPSARGGCWASHLAGPFWWAQC